MWSLENQEYVQEFLHTLHNHEMFSVTFLKNDGTVRQLTGILDPSGVTNKVAVPIIVDRDNNDRPVYKSFRMDRVIHITKEPVS